MMCWLLAESSWPAKHSALGSTLSGCAFAPQTSSYENQHQMGHFSTSPTHG
ncbi:hypothetical protein I7I51_00562 [Histoplasma capsulatum]|uniref:Uncharacterized protein n=1 Tax=Ajellomyces capsulatus TaxID=5037 RepID=A0A8A1MFW2_AJECA|nr:predicted protein [Histoplasma mississippiense (nom. inval.)]EDN08902.1 predicted protein [Histoplasma mississippiense (nom. inval.)]QSS63504.1 hypothetical protein I7I51_00562 [Histoplasma capsulatum]